MPERKARKSVAFTEEKLVVDADGSVSMVASPNDDKDTAMSHAPSTPPLSAALGAFTDPSQAHVEPAATDGVPAAEDAAAALAADDGGLDLTMKKKKKKKVKMEDEEGANDDDDDAAAVDDGGLDLSMKKKKKKKVTKEGEDEFAAKLKALDLEGKEDEEEGAAGAAGEEKVEDGDMNLGTGIWQHDATAHISYDLLLSRFFSLLAQKNPDHAASGSRSYKIPPPQCMREGSKKTIFANIAEICKRMKRTEEHVTAYLFAELGTTGSVDGSRQLVIKGRFQGKQIEAVLRKYILEYVTCKTCRSPDTVLSKGENRLVRDHSPSHQACHCGLTIFF